MPIIFFFTLSFILSCNEHHHVSLMSKLKTDATKQIELKSDQLTKDRLADFTYQNVKWEKIEPFHVLERYTSAELNKCQECHGSTNNIPQNVSNHDHIKLNHASENIMNCTTCHQEKDTWELHLLNKQDEAVSINHPYRVCAQCHFQQVNDWGHGAHGKRVGGWQGIRVVKNCTDCHNPHAPQFPKKMPKVKPNFLKYKNLK